jgi:mannosyltransferase
VPPLLVGLGALALGLYDLSRRSYWIDEAFNILLVREPWPTFVRTIVVREPSQAVYLVFLKPYVALLGQRELVTRVPSVIAFAVAVALLVDVGRRLFRLRVGVAAGLLLATNGRVLEWSQYARTYSLAVLAAVATTTLFLRACRRADRRSFLEYAVAGVVAIYCHFYAGFVLVAHAAAFLARRPRLRMRLLGEAWLVIAAGLVPFAVYVVAGTRSPVEWIPPLGGREVWQALWFACGANAALLVGAVAGVAVLLLQRRTFEATLVGGWVAAPLLCGAFVSLVKPALVPRFLIVAAPAVALLAAAAIERVRNSVLRASAVVAAAALSVPILVHTYTQNPEDWRAAARTARAAAARGSTIAVLPDFGWRALAVYAPDLERVTAPSGRVMTVLVTAGPEGRRSMVASFIDHAPYRLVRVTRVGPGFVAERWVRR